MLISQVIWCLIELALSSSFVYLSYWPFVEYDRKRHTTVWFCASFSSKKGLNIWNWRTLTCNLYSVDSLAIKKYTCRSTSCFLFSFHSHENQGLSPAAWISYVKICSSGKEVRDKHSSGQVNQSLGSWRFEVLSETSSGGAEKVSQPSRRGACVAGSSLSALSYKPPVAPRPFVCLYVRKRFLLRDWFNS